MRMGEVFQAERKLKEQAQKQAKVFISDPNSKTQKRIWNFPVYYLIINFIFLSISSSSFSCFLISWCNFLAFL